MKLSRSYQYIKCCLIFLAALFFVSCNNDEIDNRKKVASAFGNTLYEEDLRKMGTEEEMDKETREEFINEWIRQQVLLNKATTELHGIENKVRDQVAKYKANLIMFEYEKFKIQQNLDTNVTDAEILKYYEENTDDFELDDYLVQAIFIKAPKGASDLNKINLWFRSNDSLDMVKMKSWCTEEAVKFYYDNESWLYFEDIKKMLPQEMIYNEQNFIINRLARKYEEEEYVYMFRVIDFRTGVSPLDFERQNIKSRIIQMRIAELRDKLRQEILNEAYNSNEIKKY